MRLFRKSSPARPALGRWPVAVLARSTGDIPRNYQALVREAYEGNAIAQRAVRTVVESVGSAPVVSRPGRHEALALIAAPSAGQMLVETVALHILLHGNAYVETVCDGTGRPVELYALRPDRVSVETGARGWPAAHLYRVGEAVTRFAVDGEAPGLLHLKAQAPLDDHYGLGCLGAAAQAVAVHNAAGRWHKALLDNAARPSGALVFDPGEPGATMSPEQFDRLKVEMDEHFQGAANAGRPMLLEGGLKWQSLSLTPADMDFVATKAAAAREIALAFGVPPMLLGLPGDSTHANYTEANRALWRLTVLPLATRIVGGLALHLRRWWPELSLDIDRDAIPALAADRERLWSQVSAADFLTNEEKRRMLGIDHDC
jgi:HK97 family phage portal protein